MVPVEEPLGERRPRRHLRGQHQRQVMHAWSCPLLVLLRYFCGVKLEFQR